MDETNAYRVAYDRALQETKTLKDPRDLFFAWFNAGTSLVYLKDYSGAALAYDTAFGITPSIPESEPPLAHRVVPDRTLILRIITRRVTRM